MPVPVLRHMILSNRTFSCLSPRLDLIVGLKWASSGYYETFPEDVLYVLTGTTVLYIASFIQYIRTRKCDSTHGASLSKEVQSVRAVV